jgi:hypothetical protein
MAIDIAALQQRYPTWNIVDAITDPATGGIWAMGRDGGVFSLNAQGGTDGAVAKFFGAYTQHPELGAGTSARYFTKIQNDPETGGYIQVSNIAGQNYRWLGDKPIGGEKVTTPEPTKPIEFSDVVQRNLENTLREIGLGDLFSKAWTFYKTPGAEGGNADIPTTMRWLEATPEYRDHFPGLAELKEQGRAWTPAQWTTYYNTLQEAATTYGLPPGMIDRADVGKMITGNVSVPEAVGRIEAAGKSVYNADPAVIAKMHEFGFTDGDLTAFYLDDTKAEPLLARKAKESQARISVAGGGAGYGIDVGEAAQLQKWGVDEATAQAGFAQLSDLHPLFANTVGETTAGEAITEEEQLASQFNRSDQAARQEVERRLKSRQAGFQGGGGAATGGAGKTGLG